MRSSSADSKVGSVNSTDAVRVEGSAAILTLIACVSAGFWIILLRFDLVPAHFSYDGIKIQRLALASITEYEDRSYGLVAAIYATMGLGPHPTLAGMLGFLLGVIAILRALSSGSHLTPPFLAVALSALAIMLSAVYLGFYSKDVFVLPIVLLALSLPRSNRATNVAVFMGMLLYGYFFRQYWILVAAAFAIYVLVVPRLRGLRSTVALVLFGVCMLSLAIFVVLGTAPDGYRNLVNEERVGSKDASTAILPFTDITQPMGGILNNVMALASFAIPLPLLALGGVYYLLIALVFVVIWGSLIKGAARTLKGRGVATSQSGCRMRALCFVLAFITVQAVFEPDFGSALRHLTPLLPLIIFLVGNTASPNPATSNATRKFSDIEAR